jgi:hypothetical protein
MTPTTTTMTPIVQMIAIPATKPMISKRIPSTIKMFSYLWSTPAVAPGLLALPASRLTGSGASTASTKERKWTGEASTAARSSAT